MVVKGVCILNLLLSGNLLTRQQIFVSAVILFIGRNSFLNDWLLYNRNLQ